MYSALKNLNNLHFGILNVVATAVLLVVISIVPTGAQPGLLILFFYCAANALVALFVFVQNRFFIHKKSKRELTLRKNIYQHTGKTLFKKHYQKN